MSWPSLNDSLLESLHEDVEGHLEAKKLLLVLLQRITLRMHQKYVLQMDKEFLVEPMKLLLIGQSGTGKTALVESLDKLGRSYLIKADASNFTHIGASSNGEKVDELKQRIRDAAKVIRTLLPDTVDSDEKALSMIIVFVDEIDKLGGGSSWDKSTQSEFLTLFDNKDEFSGVSFIFAGAFSDITQYEAVTKSIGFSQHSQSVGEVKSIDERIIESGIIPELVGRMTAIVELDKFTEEDLFRIAKERVLVKKQRDLAAMGIFDIDLSDDKLMGIARKALKSSQGVRYLKRALDQEFLDLEFNADVYEVIYNDF